MAEDKPNHFLVTARPEDIVPAQEIGIGDVIQISKADKHGEYHRSFSSRQIHVSTLFLNGSSYSS